MLLCHAYQAAHKPRLVTFEKLHFSLMLFRRLQRLEGAQVSSPACLRVLLDGVKAVFARLKFANHRDLLAAMNCPDRIANMRPSHTTFEW